MRNFPQTPNGAPDGNGTGCGKCVGTSGHNLFAGLAVPNARAGSLDSGLSTKGAAIGGMLGDLNLTHELSERGTVTGSILSRNANLFRALAHFENNCKETMKDKRW